MMLFSTNDAANDLIGENYLIILVSSVFASLLIENAQIVIQGNVGNHH